jgi:hypothetical protein
MQKAMSSRLAEQSVAGFNFSKTAVIILLLDAIESHVAFLIELTWLQSSQVGDLISRTQTGVSGLKLVQSKPGLSSWNLLNGIPNWLAASWHDETDVTSIVNPHATDDASNLGLEYPGKFASQNCALVLLAHDAVVTDTLLYERQIDSDPMVILLVKAPLKVTFSVPMGLVLQEFTYHFNKYQC